MARLAEKNPRYRTKRQMARDALIALRSEMSPGGQHSVLSEIMWSWTEFAGKYRGCPYWTPDAIAVERKHPRQLAKRLRHEHAVPKKIVLDLLFSMTEPQADQVHAVLSDLLVGVIVTLDEDAALNEAFRNSMPPEFDDPSSPAFRDPWLRYRHCGLRVLDRSDADRPVV